MADVASPRLRRRLQRRQRAQRWFCRGSQSDMPFAQRTDIPFRDLNRIYGGIAVYRRLQSLVDTGRLYVVRATEEDKHNARLNLQLVSPNTVERAAALGIPSAPSVKLVHHITDLASRFQLCAPPPPLPSSSTSGLVLHPATMEPQFTFSVLAERVQHATGASNWSSAPREARSQRSDIHKGRHCPVTNPDGRELAHLKRGPTTAKSTIEAERSAVAAGYVEQAIESEGIILTGEDPAGCFGR